MLEKPLAGLYDIYPPNFFTRVGLRYVDRIDRSELGLEALPWKELLASHITGALGSSVQSDVMNLDSRCDIQLAEGKGLLRLRTKLEEPTSEDGSVFVIDSDFFSVGRTERSELSDQLDFLHARADRLFRWCITDRLHEAMEPNSI